MGNGTDLKELVSLLKEYLQSEFDSKLPQVEISYGPTGNGECNPTP